MNLSQFQEFVRTNIAQFHGVHAETSESVKAAEIALGQSLPQSMQWLLTSHGYSTACGIDALDESVSLTVKLRERLGLPNRYIVINDWDDAGIVWMDRGVLDSNGESPIFWSGAHNFARLATDESLDSDVTVYEDYPSWTQDRLEEALELGE